MRLPDIPRSSFLATVILAVTALAPGSAAHGHELSKAAPGTTFKTVPGIGPAKATGKGLLRVRLANDDTVLTLAMSADDGFLHSEERRLFYVALTRARLGVTIFTVAGLESPFVVELLDYPEVKLTGHSAAATEIRVCPGCGQGTLAVRKGPYGQFLGCSRFPKCRQTMKI